MCTLSFVPKERGYYAAMNRDELHTRAVAQPPAVFRAGSLQAAYPYEPGAGTWIACNDCGITLALLNWNDAARTCEISRRHSRGLVVPRLIGHCRVAEVDRELNALPLGGTLPFRLIGIFVAECALCEWRWDGSSVQQLSFPWEARHWFSSSRSDETAERERGKACAAAWRDPAAGTLPWLRELHRSHAPAPGPFSVCVHRPDAATVSYSEIVCGPSDLRFHYAPGQPCANQPGLDLVLPLALDAVGT